MIKNIYFFIFKLLYYNFIQILYNENMYSRLRIKSITMLIAMWIFDLVHINELYRG